MRRVLERLGQPRVGRLCIAHEIAERHRRDADDHPRATLDCDVLPDNVHIAVQLPSPIRVADDRRIVALHVVVREPTAELRREAEELHEPRWHPANPLCVAERRACRRDVSRGAVAAEPLEDTSIGLEDPNSRGRRPNGHHVVADFRNHREGRSGARYGNGRRSAASTTLNIAALTPIPNASVRHAAAVNPGCRTSSLRLCRTSVSTVPSCLSSNTPGVP